MSAIPGQPGTKPTQLAKPVPGEQEELTADALLADFDAPEMSMDAEGGREELTADALLNSFEEDSDESLMSPDEESLLPPDEEFAPPEEPGATGIEGFVTRLQAGLAANDTEKLNFLKKKYGPKNAVIKDGELWFRKDPKGKLKRLDPEVFELFNDIVLDNARVAVEEAALFPAEAAGFTMGLSAGPAAPVAAPAGAVAMRAAAIPAVNSFATGVARLAGVEPDPERDMRSENLSGMAAEAILPAIGRKVMKFIPGTKVYKEAKAAGKKEAVALSDQSEAVVKSLDELSQEGIHLNPMSHQIHPDNPYLLRQAAKVEEAMPGQFAQKQLEVAEEYGDAVKNNLLEIARRNGKGPVAKEKIASTITNAVEGLDRAEGKAIGNLRAQALAKLQGKKIPLPKESNETVIAIMRELGFTPRTQKLTSKLRRDVMNPILQQTQQVGRTNEIVRTVWKRPKDMNSVIGRLGLDDTQTKQVINALEEYGNYISRGGEARLTDVEKLITRLGPLNKRLGGSQIAGTWGKLTGQLRQHRRDIIGNSLETETDKVLFNTIMDDFSMIRKNTEQLSNVLRDDVTAKTLVSSFFKGKENLANIRAIKAITGKNSPEWVALKAEFIDQLMMKHASDGATGFNSAGFLRDLKNNYGDDFVKEVLDDGAGPNYKTIENLLAVGKRIEAMTKGAKAEQLTKRQEDAIANTAIGFLGGVHFKRINGLSAIIRGQGSTENAAMEIFNRNGYEKYLANYKGDKSKAAQNIERMLEIYNAGRAKSAALDAADKTVRAGAKGAKRLIRGKAREEIQR